MATLPCSRRVIGAIAALKAGAGLILRDRLKEAACTTVSNFKLGDDTSILTKEVEDIFQKQLETIATLQRVQSAKDENFSLLGHEVRTTQEIVINLLGTVNDRLQTLDLRQKVHLNTRGINVVQRILREKKTKHFFFHQKIRYVVSRLSTLYIHVKSYQAAFYAYRITLISISSPVSSHITP